MVIVPHVGVYGCQATSLLGGDGDEVFSRISSAYQNERVSFLSAVPCETLLEWCRGGSSVRWVMVASLVAFSGVSERDGESRWTDDVIRLVESAPVDDRVAVCRALIDYGCWDVTADFVPRRLPLLDQLSDMLGAGHEAEVTEWRRELNERIARAERRDQERQRGLERFE